VQGITEEFATVTSGPIEPCPVDAVPGVLAAFAKAPLVALGEAHWLAEQAEFVARLIAHPAFPAVAGDIVVEFGNARYQQLADAFTGGEPADGRDLARVWQHAGGPGQAFTSPIYREFFHTVRAINASAHRASRCGCCWVIPPIGTCAAAPRTPGPCAIRGTPTSPR